MKQKLELFLNMITFKIVAMVLIAIGGTALLALVLHALTWAPFLVSVSWNA